MTSKSRKVKVKDHVEGKKFKGSLNSPAVKKRLPPPKAVPIPALEYTHEVKIEKVPEDISGYDSLLGAIPSELAKLDSEEVEDVSEYPLLSEVGKVLPTGFVDQNGEKHRDFELTEWNWEMEEMLGELTENNPDMPINHYVSEIIGHGISRIGTIRIDRMKRSQKRLLARSLYFSDALYIYIWIRIASLGPYLKLDKFKCPSCRKIIDKFAADLRTLEVKSYEKIPEVLVKLEHGIEYSGERFKSVVVGPIKWAFMETDDRSILSNAAKFKMATLHHGIIKIPGAPEGPVYLTKKHLSSMKLVEINKLVTEIDQCAGGAVMQISSKCPHCKGSFTQDINWNYDDFFAPSSH
jgi:hypothetical protein